MFISIFRRVMVAEEDEEVEEVWDEVLEEVLEEVNGDEALDEDIMVAQEEASSTIQPISKITPHLMYTFIRRRHPM